MKRFWLPLVFLALMAFPSTVQADVAPPYFPPGSNPQPGVETTAVRMASERVVMDVINDMQPGSLGSAAVTADFTMHNTGSRDETMAVRFPISSSDGRGQYPEIAGVRVRVDGRQVALRRVEYPDELSPNGKIPWVEFEVKFPAGVDTAIQVSYTLQGTGYPPYSAFYYILRTGAGWNGTIGSADVILKLPYPASDQNVVLGLQIGWAETTPGASFHGNEVRWHFEDFEPGTGAAVQNMEFALVAPSAWNAVLKEQANAAKDPADAEAWGRLGKAYKQVFLMNKGYREDPGGADLYRLAVAAYETCLSLNPEDAQWHAGFADLLAGRAYWDSWMKGATPDAMRAIEEIHTALELAPRDTVVQEIAANISYLFPDGVMELEGAFDFPWLTRTPTAIPPTATIVPAFDPASVTGNYQGDWMVLSNQKKARLALTLSLDHTAVLDTEFEKEPPVRFSGTWMDNGDGNLTVTLEDPNRGEVRFVFKVNQGRIKTVEYPGLYQGGVELVKKVSITPSPQEAASSTSVPGPSRTPQPTIERATPNPNPTAARRTGLPFCGSIALVPIAGILWGARALSRRKTVG